MDTTHNSLLYMAKFIERYPQEKQGELSDQRYLELLNIWQQNFAPDMRDLFERKFGERPDTNLELERFIERYFRENELTEEKFDKYREIINEVRLEEEKDTIARDMGYINR